MDSIPMSHKAGLAHFYLMCTSQDMTPFFLEPEEAVETFRLHVLKKDMSVRVASRLISIGAVMDFVVAGLAREGPEARTLSRLSRFSNVVSIEGPLWKKTLASWLSFRQNRFSSANIAQWFMTMEEKENRG